MNKVSKIRSAAVGLLLGLSGVALAATFNLFSPANGILKGNANSYITQAALSSDVISLWTGTCNASSVLKGDGSCAAAATGSVTSVALTMPSGLSVAGSPITSSGTLAVTTALNGVVHANGSGFSASNVLLGSEVTGTLPVGNGGTGATTLTGLLKGNGTSAFTAATSADVISLWTGTCNGSSYLAGDGSCQTVSGGASGANPTASVGLTAVNGSAPTFLRSDGAPALDQSISPSWTGYHTFGATSARYLGLYDSAAGSNAKNVLFRSGGGGFNISSATDAAPTTAVTNILASVRSGSAWSSLSFGNATDNPTASFLGTGGVTFNGTPTITHGASETLLALQNTAAGADAKNTLIRLNSSGAFAVWGAADATPTTAVTNFMAATRTGAAWSALNFGNTTDNTAFSFLGTGTTTFGSGKVVLNFGSSSSSDAGLTFSSTRPVINIWDTDVTDDRVVIQNNGGDFRIDAINAAASVINSAFTMTQTAGVVDSIALAGTAITANGQTVAITRTGTFSATLSGLGGTPTIRYVKTGQTVCLNIPTHVNQTSSSTLWSITNVPSSNPDLSASTTQVPGVSVWAQDNSVVENAYASFTGTNNIQVANNGANGGFSNSGNSGWYAFTFCYIALFAN